MCSLQISVFNVYVYFMYTFLNSSLACNNILITVVKQTRAKRFLGQTQNTHNTYLFRTSNMNIKLFLLKKKLRLIPRKFINNAGLNEVIIILSFKTIIKKNIFTVSNLMSS